LAQEVFSKAVSGTFETATLPVLVHSIAFKAASVSWRSFFEQPVSGEMEAT
jgi:hypothetical protein